MFMSGLGQERIVPPQQKLRNPQIQSILYCTHTSGFTKWNNSTTYKFMRSFLVRALKDKIPYNERNFKSFHGLDFQTSMPKVKQIMCLKMPSRRQLLRMRIKLILISLSRKQFILPLRFPCRFLFLGNLNNPQIIISL